MKNRIRDFVTYTGDKHPELKGKIGAVIRNETCGGVFRGHVDLWFGEVTEDGSPCLFQVLTGDCELVPDDKIPVGEM